MQRITSIGFSMMLGLAAAACSADNEDGAFEGSSHGGAGGQATGGAGGSDVGGDGDAGGSGGGPAQTPLEALCAEECEKAQALQLMFSCLYDPTCAPDCVEYGLSVGDCQDEYVSLLQCVAASMNSRVCYCAQGDDLQCDLCEYQRSVYAYCLDGGF